MPVSEPLASLLRELDAMSSDDRAVVLGALSRSERDLLTKLTGTTVVPDPQGSGTSPWLAAHVQAARRGESAMTPATRAALLRAVGLPRREPLPVGRSLAGAFGGLLASRGLR